MQRQCRDQYSCNQSRLGPPKRGFVCGVTSLLYSVFMLQSNSISSRRWDYIACVLLPQVVAFVRREWDYASTYLTIWLSRGFVGLSSALRPCSCRFWVCSFRIASVEPAGGHPPVSPTPEPSTVVFQVCCGTAILQSSHQ